jgi:TorA maturation chaperone TorD
VITGYRLLSVGFCVPDDEYLTPDDIQLLVDSLGELDPSGIEHARAVGDLLAATSAQDLQVAYAALFVGPFQVVAPPYGSIYLESGRRLMGDSTLDVIGRYRAAGVEMDSEQKDMPDHAAVELEFAAFLAQRELEALSEGDANALRRAATERLDFLSNHLGAWVTPFADAIRGAESSQYFAELASCAEVLVNHDLAVLREMVAA